MLLKMYTKMHNYMWIKMYHYCKKRWNINGNPPKLLILFCYLPFPSEFQKQEKD